MCAAKSPSVRVGPSVGAMIGMPRKTRKLSDMTRAMVRPL